MLFAAAESRLRGACAPHQRSLRRCNAKISTVRPLLVSLLLLARRRTPHTHLHELNSDAQWCVGTRLQNHRRLFPPFLFFSRKGEKTALPPSRRRTATQSRSWTRPFLSQQTRGEVRPVGRIATRTWFSSRCALRLPARPKRPPPPLSASDRRYLSLSLPHLFRRSRRHFSAPPFFLCCPCAQRGGGGSHSCSSLVSPRRPSRHT